MYIPKYFGIKELVPPETYNAVANKDSLWWLFDDRLLKTLDMLRDKYGPVYCNNWDNGLKYRGFRPEDAPAGVKMSQHKRGRAADCHFKNVSVEEVRKAILTNPLAEAFKYITCIERDVTWLHFDVRNWDKFSKGILVVSPT